MHSTITRAIKGLEILQKYKGNAGIHGASNATWLLESQEEEYLEISEEDRSALNLYGWRQRKSAPYRWVLATDQGLVKERDNPDLFR